jgi:hypothetical protein
MSNPIAHASSDTVTVTPTNSVGKTVLQVSDNPSSTSNIFSFNLQIKAGSFMSFKLDNGWTGKKTSTNTIALTSSNPIKPGSSSTFVIGTDQQSPDLMWSAFDVNNNQLGSGEIGALPTGPTTGPVTGPTTTTNNPGILELSSFRIIPSNPSPGYAIRVVGQSFAASANLDLYAGDQKIDSFISGNNGNFVVTTTIPQTQQPGNAVLALKDQSGNQKTFTVAIQPSPVSRNQTSQFIPLTLNMNPIYHRGDTWTINGTSSPGSTVTFSLEDSSGTSITSFTAKADNKGFFSISGTVPIDRPFGKYTIVATDGKSKVSKDSSLVSSHQISISTSQIKYEPGDTVVINGTAISNEPVSIIINDPTGYQIFAKDVNVTSDGKISVSVPISTSAIIGTYVVTASQADDSIPYYFGVGQDPAPKPTAKMDKLNYLVNDRPTIYISAQGSSTLNLVIVDPSDKEKFSDLVKIGPDGLATYQFNLTAYTPGIYAAVLTRGNDKVVVNFAVGLQTGCGQINMNSVKDTYVPGDNIILLGTSNANCIIQLTLTDPHGILIKSKQTFTDKAGHFSAFDFRIPGDGAAGDWKLDAASGIDHKSLDINVRSLQAMTVQFDKTPAVYSRGDIVNISGIGAGKSVDVIINVISATNNVVDTFDVQSTNTGDYDTPWTIPKDFSPGTYTILVKAAAEEQSSTITIQ